MNQKNEVLKILKYLTILIPVMISVTLVLLYGVNVPFADEWGLVDLFQKNAENNLKFEYFYAQHNEHRIFFPRVILLLSGLISNWNLVVQMLISQIMLLLVGILYFNYFKSITSLNSKYFLHMLPVSFFLFNLRQWENMFTGFQIVFFMVLTSAVCSFFCYDKYRRNRSNKYFIMTAIFAIIASFSAIQGLLVWVAFLAFFILQRIFESKRIGKKEVILLMIGLLCWIMYFFDYHKPPSHPAYFQGGILKTIICFIASIGSSLFSNLTAAALFGGITVILSIICVMILIIKKQIIVNTFPCLMLIFGFEVLASIAVGRGGFGIGSSTTSRYTTYSLLVLTALYMILTSILTKRKLNINVCRSILVIFSVFLCTLSISNISEIKTLFNQKKFAAYSLSHFENVPNEFRKSYFPIVTEPYMTQFPLWIKNKGYSVFSNNKNAFPDLPGIILSPNSIGEPLIGMQKENITVVENEFLVINGVWVVDQKAQEVASSVWIKIDGKYYKAYYGIARPDVQKHFSNKKYLNSGLVFSIPISKLDEDAKQLQVIAVGKNQSYYYESLPYEFEIQHK